jgi:hypothetical protein
VFEGSKNSTVSRESRPAVMQRLNNSTNADVNTKAKADMQDPTKTDFFRNPDLLEGLRYKSFTLYVGDVYLIPPGYVFVVLCTTIVAFALRF